MLNIETFKQEFSELNALIDQLEIKRVGIYNELASKFNNNEFDIVINKLISKDAILELLSSSAIELSKPVEKSVLIDNLYVVFGKLSTISLSAISEYAYNQVAVEGRVLEDRGEELLAKYGITRHENEEGDYTFSSDTNPEIAEYLNNNNEPEDQIPDYIDCQIDGATFTRALDSVFLVKDVAGEPGMAYLELGY